MRAPPDDALKALAAEAGIAVEWEDAFGAPQSVGIETLRHLLHALGIPCVTPGDMKESRQRIRAEASAPPALIVGRTGKATPWPAGLPAAPFRITLEGGGIIDGKAGLLPVIDRPGYHILETGECMATLAVAPPHCFSVADACAGQRAWGIAAQLYGLRRAGDGGIGDFGGLAELTEAAAAWGCDAVSISPVHALFTAEPGRASPYAPSNRLFLNPLHADPRAAAGPETVAAAVADTGLSDEFARLEAAPLIDWEKAGRAKLALLRAVWKRLAPQFLPGSGPLAEDLEDFTRRGGEALRDHAVFEALQAAGHGGSLHDPRSADTAAFAREAAGEVAFHIFLQWLTDRSMSEAQTAALKAGQRIGLIADLAVGIEGGGSYAWSRPDDILSGVEIGAPPDLFNRQGQRWGLTAISPHALARQGFSPFIETLHAVLRHAGGLRIDHVLGLARLWLVPQGMAPGEGAYLRFPFQTLLALIALESHRHRAVIVGEDLGTVPHGLRNDLAAVGLMGMRVLWFEREGDAFQDAALWPHPVAAMTSTHDLPTVAGWWSGRDISWRNKPGLPSAEDEKERAGEKTALWQAFRRAGLASGPVPTEAEEAVTAAVGFVARTPADLALIPLEDILGLSEQPNLPGTTSEHPNWCRRLPMETTQALAAPPPRQRLERLAGERPRS